MERHRDIGNGISNGNLRHVSQKSELKIHLRLSVACLCNAWSDRPTESGERRRPSSSAPGKSLPSYAAHNLVKAAACAALANASFCRKSLSNVMKTSLKAALFNSD